MYASIAEIKRANRKAGRHYFDREAVEFFHSRVEPEIIGGRYFIDSTEFCPSDGPCEPRRYSVCVADARGHVTHVSRPGQFPNKARALAAARVYAADQSSGNHCRRCGKELPLDYEQQRCRGCLDAAFNRAR